MSDPDAVETRRVLAYLAAGLVRGGTPVYEVEEDVRQVAAVLGHPNAQVSATPTGVFVGLASGEPATFERVEGQFRLDQLAEVNAVRAGLLARRLPVPEATELLWGLRSRPHRYSFTGLHAGALLVGGGLGLVLAQSWSAVLFALLLSPVVTGLTQLSGRVRSLGVLLPGISAFIAAMVVLAAYGQGWVSPPLWAIVAPLAVILPGATLTTGISELAGGAMVTGTARLAYGAMLLLQFAVGIAVAAALVRPAPEAFLQPRVNEIGWWGPVLGVVLVVAGMSLMESVPVRLAVWIFPLVLLTFGAINVGQWISPAPWVGALLGAIVASAVAAVAEFVRPELPRVAVFLPSFWLLVPGSLGLVSITQLEADPRAALVSIFAFASVAIAIALGILVGATIAQTARAGARRIGLRRLLARVPRMRRGRGAGASGAGLPSSGSGSSRLPR